MEDIKNSSVYKTEDSQVTELKSQKKSLKIFQKIHIKLNWKKVVVYLFLLLLAGCIGYVGYRFYNFKPYRVFVTNISSRSATVSWITEFAEPGVVYIYGR